MTAKPPTTEKLFDDQDALDMLESSTPSSPPPSVAALAPNSKQTSLPKAEDESKSAIEGANGDGDDEGWVIVRTSVDSSPDSNPVSKSDYSSNSNPSSHNSNSNSSSISTPNFNPLTPTPLSVSNSDPKSPPISNPKSPTISSSDPISPPISNPKSPNTNPIAHTPISNPNPVPPTPIPTPISNPISPNIVSKSISNSAPAQAGSPPQPHFMSQPQGSVHGDSEMKIRSPPPPSSVSSPSVSRPPWDNLTPPPSNPVPFEAPSIAPMPTDPTDPCGWSECPICQLLIPPSRLAAHADFCFSRAQNPSPPKPSLPSLPSLPALPSLPSLPSLPPLPDGRTPSFL